MYTSFPCEMLTEMDDFHDFLEVTMATPAVDPSIKVARSTDAFTKEQKKLK